jgi:hypothetical protein
MIGEDIYIIDDVIPLSKQTEIEDLFTHSRIPWIFNRDISLTQQEIKKLGIKKLTPGIGTPIKDYQSKYVNSEILDKIKIIPEQACIGIDKICDEIYQARGFIHFPLIPELKREYDNIHIDLSFEHLVVLYYVNDTDGDTFIFDKTTDYENINLASVENQNQLNIIKRISPKKGRALVFNGNRYHSSSGPTKDIRCIINFDITIKNK